MKLRHDLMNNVAYEALWEKVLEGFREISGDGWETRANYEHFWPLVHRLYQLAYGPKAKLPDELKAPLAFMFAGHAGRMRKGLRSRPYFHHILMVVYLAWVLRLPLDYQKASISHDDVEDIPKNLGVSAEWVTTELIFLIGQTALAVVLNLSNVQHPQGKHVGQREKMAKIPHLDAMLKLLDRIANLFDMRRDKPKGFGPDRIRAECVNALELAEAMPVPAHEPVLALLAFSVDLLAKENNISMAEVVTA